MSQTTSICQSCHAGCCRAYAIPLTGADVLRLERTGLKFWDFVCRWADPEGIIAGNYAPHLYFEDEPSTPFTLCLLHEPSQTFPATTKCRFLQENPPDANSPLGTARCGAYDHRPAACRVFPLHLQASTLLTVLGDVPSHGRREDSSESYHLCPRSWGLDDIDPIEGPQDVAVAKFEAQFFQQVAASWNQRPGSWLRFPEFLTLVYEQRVVKSKAAGVETDIAPFPAPNHVSRQRRAA